MEAHLLGPSRIPLIVGVSLFALLVIPAFAADQAEWQNCRANTSTNPDQSIASCTRIIGDTAETPANRAKAYFNRGLAYSSKKDYDRAIADFSEAIRLNPKQQVYYLGRGNCYYGKGDYDRSIVDYTEAIKVNPKYFEAFNKRGKAYAAKRDYSRAIADYTEAIRLDPNYVDAYNNRGIAFKALRRRAEAIADFRKALSIDPADQTSQKELRSLGG